MPVSAPQELVREEAPEKPELETLATETKQVSSIPYDSLFEDCDANGNEIEVEPVTQEEDDIQKWQLFITLRTSLGYTDPRRTELRDERFFRYRSYAASAARSYCSNSMPYRSLIDPQDVAMYADIGLLEAIESFELGKGATFKTHSYYRILGSILDGLRSLQDFPRLVSKVKRELAPLLQSLTHELGRHATVEELGARYPKLTVSGMTIAEIISDPLVFAGVYNQSDDKKQLTETSEYCAMLPDTLIEKQMLRYKSCEEPDRRVCFIDTIEKILKILSSDEHEQTAIFCYFFLGMTSTEISKSRKLSPTWVSAKKESGLQKIRQAVRRDKDLAEELLTK